MGTLSFDILSKWFGAKRPGTLNSGLLLVAILCNPIILPDWDEMGVFGIMLAKGRTGYLGGES